jgi:hypothetical protein
MRHFNEQRSDELRADMKPLDVMKIMSEDNPQALQAILAMSKLDPKRYLTMLTLLDDMNIRGSQFVICVKEVCKGDLRRLMDMVEDASDGGGCAKLADACNKKGFEGFHEHFAVVRGRVGSR